MSTVTAIQPHAASDVLTWTPDQRALIKRTVAPNATDDELAMFLHVAAKAGLDPLQRQIHFTKRRVNVGSKDSPKWEERVTIQAGVDGLQARALRFPDCQGIQSAAVFEKQEFVFDNMKGEVVRHQGNPFTEGRAIGAWAIVRREGKAPFVALVRMDEYFDDRSFLWKGKPAVMIEKVARSTALRRAYPENFGGIYDPAEMGRDAAPEATKALEAEVVATLPEPTPAPALPAAGKIEAPPTEAARNVTVAAEVLGGKVEAPKTVAAPKRVAPPPPPYVLALFQKLVKSEGTKELAQAAFKTAAEGIWGETPKPSNEWTPEDCAKVEAALFPVDVPF